MRQIFATEAVAQGEGTRAKKAFWTFVKSNDREHQVLTRIFGTNLPAPAHYYNSTSELVYNIKTEIGSYNWDHFIDHCERLPLDFLRDNGPKFDYSLFKAPRFYKKPPAFASGFFMESGGDLLSRTVTSQVPSALKGLTSVFGMGTGGTPSSLPPEMVSYFCDFRSFP